jgi:hypothetical protein
MYDHPSEWGAPGTNILAECKEISTVRSTSDAFGRLKGGELHIPGCNVKAKILETDKKDWIGSEWGPHRLRMEISSKDAAEWGFELIIDTIEDARAAVGASVSIGIVVDGKLCLFPCYGQAVDVVEEILQDWCGYS